MAVTKNIDMWHRGVGKGAGALDNAWRRTNLRQSNVWHQCKVINRGFVHTSYYVVCDFYFLFFIFYFLLLFIFVFFLRYM